MNRPDWDTWLSTPVVSIYEALILSCNMEPGGQAAEPDINDIQSITRELNRRVKIVESHVEVDTFKTIRIRPGDFFKSRIGLREFIKFALRSGWDIPAELAALKDEDVDALQPSLDLDAKPPQAELGSPPNWKMQIQAQAAILWRRYRANNANPTKNSIKDDLAKWCRQPENNVKTPSGINPTAEYIARHVLREWTPPGD